MTPDFARFLAEELRRRAREDCRGLSLDLVRMPARIVLPPSTKDHLARASRALLEAAVSLEHAADEIHREDRHE